MVGCSLTNFWKDNKFLVTGGNGFLGKHIIHKMIYENKVPEENITIPNSYEMDLRLKENCIKAVKNQNMVIHLAARVGGIEYNRTHPGSLFYDNTTMGVHLLEASRLDGITKFIGIGSVCAYPKDVPIPTKEEHLWLGYPESSNAAYGLSKKMLLIQSQAYNEQYKMNNIYLLLANLYGPGDNFNPNESHVIPALIKRMMDAKHKNQNEITLWGSGNATRDFLYVKDAAEGILQATEYYNQPYPVNLASGHEISIKELARIIQKEVEYTGNIIWNTSMPDGQPRRLFDIEKAKQEFNFNPKTSFIEGIRETIKWYKENLQQD